MAHFRKECITFFMTTTCNLACTYCYLNETDLPSQSININFAKRGILDFFENRNELHIRFFGAGEPTLEFQKIKELTEFSRELAGDRLTVEIQTNGVFSKKVANWLSLNADIIWISVDGTPDIHDIQRPTIGGKITSNIIERNIRLLKNIDRELIVGTRVTITPKNINRQIEILDYFRLLGIDAVFSDPVFSPVAKTPSEVIFLELNQDFNLEYAKQFLKAKEYSDEIGIFYGSILTVNFDEPTEYFCRACLPMPHLTTDGYVSCCDMSYLKNTLPELIYGEYCHEKDIIIYDQRQITKFRLRKASNLIECKNCEILNYCAGACFGEGFNETGEILGVKKDYCDAIRFLAKNMELDSGRFPYLHP